MSTDEVNEMNTNKIPDFAKEYIIKEVRKEDFDPFRRMNFYGLYEADKYAHQMDTCWEVWGFDSRIESEMTYREFITAQRIITWCRRNKQPTRKGTVHCYNGHHETDLWRIVNGSGLDNEACGVRWSIRKVDQLKNIYIWF